MKKKNSKRIIWSVVAVIIITLAVIGFAIFIKREQGRNPQYIGTAFKDQETSLSEESKKQTQCDSQSINELVETQKENSIQSANKSTNNKNSNSNNNTGNQNNINKSSKSNNNTTNTSKPNNSSQDNNTLGNPDLNNNITNTQPKNDNQQTQQPQTPTVDKGANQTKYNQKLLELNNAKNYLEQLKNFVED